MSSSDFYQPDLARIHHAHFGQVAQAGARFAVDQLAAAGLKSGTVVELGVGSGLSSQIFLEAGYAAVGYDLSPAMVALAQKTAPGARVQCRSIFEVDPPEAVCVTALGEVLNYAMDDRAGPDALSRLLTRIHRALDPRGMLIMDILTPGRAGPTGVRDRLLETDDFTMFVHMEAQEGVLTRDIITFAATDEGYRKQKERHVQRTCTPSQMTTWLQAAGFLVETLHTYPRYGPLAQLGGARRPSRGMNSTCKPP